MMYATKIKMKSGCASLFPDLLAIYIDGCDNPGYFDKAILYDYLKTNPGSIAVNISPFPQLIPALSVNGEKYVKSTPDWTNTDNLLRLPRE